MKRILVLTWTSFNKWSLKRLGLDVFKKPNYKVIVYDVSNILFKRFNKINSQHYRKDNLKIFNFYNKKKLVKELKENNYDIVINTTGCIKTENGNFYIVGLSNGLVKVFNCKSGAHLVDI